MIYPTRAAALAAGVGVPVALAVAAVAPGRWPLALAWPLALFFLCLVDAMRSFGSVAVEVQLPDSASVGETRDMLVSVRVGRAGRPPFAEVAMDSPSLVRIADDGRVRIELVSGEGAAWLPMDMARRGMARFDAIWIRWSGPLGLAWHQSRVVIDSEFPVLPDSRPVYQRGAQIFQRYSAHGLIAQIERGEGTDFDALLEFQTGMDRRSIDWKHSARHGKLLAKHYRTERNNQIVFAVDSGRQMSEPVGGIPRVDRAVSAMLLTAWVALKMGDRVAVHAFDSRPRLASGLVSGARGFPELQRAAAAIDYSGEETNYTFALTTLVGRLSRRSMIVLFTEFTNAISADFLVRAARRLVETHLLLVIVLRDEELERIVEQTPAEPDDVTRAITANALLKDRRVVLTSLQRLGVHVIEADHDRVGEELVAGYMNLKRRNLL